MYLLMSLSIGRMDLNLASHSPLPHRSHFNQRWSTRVMTFLAKSRALSSVLFIALIVLTDHAVHATDQYMNKYIEGSYDPLVIATSENVLMIAAAMAMYALLSRRKFFDHSDWIRRVCWKELLLTGFLLGVEGVMWALSSKRVTQRFGEGAVVLAVPIVLIVRYTFFEASHLFHWSGAVYASMGLLAMSFSQEEISLPSKFDYYHLGYVLMWSLCLLCVADFFTKNKRIPVIGVVVVMLCVRLVCVTVTTVTLVGTGNVHVATFQCMLGGVGTDCSTPVPFTLIAHSVALLVRLSSYVVVVKYIGAPICVVTTAASMSLKFYSHSSVTSVDVGAALLSVLGCVVFTHGQWILEASTNEEWDDQLRQSIAPTTLFTSSDEDRGEGLDENEPLVMNE